MDLKFDYIHEYTLCEDDKRQGGGSTLYKALDLNLGRHVAVKAVPIPGTTKREREKALEKALNEVKIMVELEKEHLSIPHIYEAYFNKEKSTLYIVMQWIDGDTLDKKMGVDEKKFLNWMIDLCHILKTMSRHHVSHKDIKPSNIMITKSHKLFLIDFNLSLSTPNLLDGTHGYKAPEMDTRYDCVGGHREKVDMFSIGVILYEFYTKAIPTRGVDYARTKSRGTKEWNSFIEPKEKCDVLSEDINSIIVKCMKYNYRDRYSNYGELQEALKQARRRLK